MGDRARGSYDGEIITIDMGQTAMNGKHNPPTRVYMFTGPMSEFGMLCIRVFLQTVHFMNKGPSPQQWF